MMYTLFAVFSPALAAGAAVAAVGVPLVVHLLFRKRYQIVPWAAIRFLLVAERRHKRRVDQWLLFALRALVLALFLLAMVATTAWAERIWQAVKPGAAETVASVPRTHHVIVLDASHSMTARTDDGRTRFERAVAQAADLVRSGNPGDGYTVFVMAGTAVPLVPGPSNDPEKVVAELNKARVTHGAADHTAALAHVADVLTKSPRAYPRRQLTFFTDLQRASWAGAVPLAENNNAEVWQRIAARADVAVVDAAGGRDLDNLAVAEVALDHPMPLVDQPAGVSVTVANLGRAERKNVRVELLLGRPSGGGDALVSVEQKPIDVIPAGGRGSVKFDLAGAHGFRDRGIHVIQAKLVEGDGLAADDTRALAVEVRDGVHALLVEGKADPDPERRAATYIARALFPPNARPSDTPARPRTVSPNEFLDPNVCDLTGVDCVFVCDVFNPTPDMAAKLDAVLRRGGTVIFGLGPNVAASRARYNAVLYRDGHGVLPGAIGEVVAKPNPDAPDFRLHARDEEYLKPPLLAFNNDNARAALTGVGFQTYMKIDVPEGAARNILTFARPGAAAPDPKAGSAAKPDAALVEWPRHRGRVYVFTSSFNFDWNGWPYPFTFLVFWNEFLKYSVANPDRHTLRVGEPIEEFFAAGAAGLDVGISGPDGADGLPGKIPLVLQDEAGFAKFTGTTVSGLYRLGLNGARDRVFAVNGPDVVAGAPTESDLRQVGPNEFKRAGSVQVVSDPMDVKATDESGAVVTTQPKPWGPAIGRFAVFAALVLLAAELLIAWRFGPSRAAGGSVRPPGGSFLLRLAGTAAALVPLAAAGFLLFTAAHAERTGNPLGFLPHEARSAIEGVAGVPVAGPGEGTKWRLEGFTAFFRNAVTDRRVVAAVALACVALTVGVYRLERRAAGGLIRVAAPALLRAATFLLALFVVLAQLRLAFDREGYPEVVILLDTSASMSKSDEFKDAAVRAKAQELAGTNLSETNRLRLAQLLLTRKGADWLDRFLKEKQVKVHLYAVDTQTRELTAIDDESQLADGRAAIGGLKPEGTGSHLGDGVGDVLKAFRGSPLAAIVMFTDGVTTAGDDLPRAARAASLDGVPLFLVGVGDTWEAPDLALSDFRGDEVVGRGDRVAFEVRLTARGEVPTAPVTVLLKEKMPDGRTEEVRGQKTVRPDPSGNPVAVTVEHTPTEAGEKTFVLEVPAVPGETDTRNNRLERSVQVTESRKIRVLYVEGYPRYDFRFVKVMLERESDKSVGGKSVELQVVLLDASKGWAETDRSAFRGEFPTRTELFNFDVVILGDVDPKQIGGARAAVVMRDLADFVKEKGGGLLFLCGEHGTPAAFADTPLAEVLPVVPGDAPPARRPPEEQPITEEYHPRLTPAGRIHPLFRFSSDEGESARVWGAFRPLLWYAKNYRRKPLTSVLAEHPTRPAEGGPAGERHPLVVQQFVGAGPVLFVGFDDTWRWRFRAGEEHFDRFWMQAVRVLSRSRVRRPELRVSKSEYRRDEKVTVQVLFPIEAPPPGGAPVRVSVVRAPLPNRDGTPGTGPTDTGTLVLARVNGPTVQYEATLARAPEGEYRFTLTDPEPAGAPPSAVARVLPPMSETERVELNRADLQQAAAVSGGGFYTLATADDVFTDLKNLQRVPLNQPCPPVPLWNQPLAYLLVILLLTGEWLLRKRERLL